MFALWHSDPYPKYTSCLSCLHSWIAFPYFVYSIVRPPKWDFQLAPRATRVVAAAVQIQTAKRPPKATEARVAAVLAVRSVNMTKHEAKQKEFASSSFGFCPKNMEEQHICLESFWWSFSCKVAFVFQTSSNNIGDCRVGSPTTSLDGGEPAMIIGWSLHDLY